MILKDLICNKENIYKEVFSPSRFTVEEIPQILKDGGKAVKGLAKRYFEIPDENIKQIQPEHGEIVDMYGEKLVFIKQKMMKYLW